MIGDSLKLITLVSFRKSCKIDGNRKDNIYDSLTFGIKTVVRASAISSKYW